MMKPILFISAVILSGLSANAQTILGIDVSSYQGNPTWSSVKGAGYTFAYAKATEGTGLTDGSFVYNMTNGTSAGMKMGAYHFCDPINDAASADASYFLSVAQKYITNCYMPPMLDVEDTPGDAALSTMGGAALTTWVVAWCTAVKTATGITPIIYTDGSYAALMQAGATKYGLWIATVSGSPTIGPTTTGSWSTWVFNQYSWTVTVPGISGDVDADVFNGNTTAFNALIPCNGVTAAFTSNITTGCAGMTVNYTDKSTASAGTLTKWSWTFQGGSPGTSNVQNPTGITYATGGTYYVKEVVTSTTGKDSITLTSYIDVIPTATLPLSETFQTSTFPPTGWTINTASPGDSIWELCKSNGYSSSQCMYFPANCGQTGNITGERSRVFTPDFSFATTVNAYLSFDVAYEPSSLPTYSDTLVVYYSTDCGTTWTSIYSKGGATLCTTGSTTSAKTDVNSNGCFVPPTASTTAWRKDSVSLSVLNNKSGAMFSFECRSGWGNIIYLDNIDVSVPSSTTSIQNLSESSGIKVYPNPNSGSFNILFPETPAEKTLVLVYDALGRQVYLAPIHTGTTQITLDERPSGIYFYRIMTESGGRLISEGKLIVQH